ncbi:MAG: ATP-binding protein, partial [Acidimicrobiales bacterium]
QATVPTALDSQAGYAVAYDAPVVVDDLSRETRFRVPPLLVTHGVVSGMSVIIMGGAGPWGVLGGHTSSRRRFSADDAHVLQATANILAEAISRAEVEGALRAARDEERRLRQRLEAHSRAAVDAQEGERRRIARELHDEIGQALTGLKLVLENHERLPPEAKADRMGRARALVGELLRQVQDLSLDLRPAMLDDLGLRPALLWLVERYAAQTGVEVALECTGLDGRLRPEVETAAYRIVQEALTNVARHAGVGLVTVGCSMTEDSVRVEVSDEGVGFEIEALPPGQSSGLAGMEERARSTGGQFRVRSELGRGTSVLAELPLGERPRPDP